MLDLPDDDDGIDISDRQLREMEHTARRLLLKRQRNKDLAVKQYRDAILAEASRLFDYAIQGVENVAEAMREWGEAMNKWLEELRNKHG